MKRLFPFYYFDEETLEFKRVNLRTLILLFGISLFASILIVPSIYKSSVIKIMYADFYEPESVVLNVSESKNEFSEEKLIGVLTDLNIKFPHIVLAQSKLETGQFKSNIFKENHNLFGMKEAKIRVNLAKGTQYGHAFYNNWIESVYDYAFYQSTYLSRIKTEEQYFEYLDQSYAEAENYVEALKVIIERENLKDVFANR
jgi:hypothetical protein